MPDTQDIVINTSPLIALVAALGDLSVLQMYRQVWVPLEVSDELAAGGAAKFALAEYMEWASEHQAELMINWDRTRRQAELARIRPLEQSYVDRCDRCPGDG